MECFEINEDTPVKIHCCECGALMDPNTVNMCVACVRTRVDITEGIPKQARVNMCRLCKRYLSPPNTWTYAELESKELLALLLRKMKPAMTKVRLIDATFIWTEPHSQRVKVKLTVQKEILNSAILQQSFIIEFTIINQMCEDCRRIEAKDYWRACVQVRQKCDFKKTLFYLEQLMLKHRAQVNATGVKPVATGIDFYYPKLQDARKLVDFIASVLPCKYKYAQELVTHDTKNNTYDYKHTFCVDIVPLCRDDVICLPKKVAQALGNMNQLVVCLRISNFVVLIDPSTAQIAEISANVYWRYPFTSLCQMKQLTEFYVVDVEAVEDLKLGVGHGHISNKHQLADVWIVRSDQVGRADHTICTRSHLGHILKPGDLVMGLDVHNSNVNSPLLDEMRGDRIPDVILVRKVYDRALRTRRRNWKLKRLVIDGNVVKESASVENDFEAFMDDIEEDEQLRQEINIYRDQNKTIAVDANDTDIDLPQGPSLQEMLDDLDLDDVEMAD